MHYHHRRSRGWKPRPKSLLTQIVINIWYTRPRHNYHHHLYHHSSRWYTGFATAQMQFSFFSFFEVQSRDIKLSCYTVWSYNTASFQPLRSRKESNPSLFPPTWQLTDWKPKNNKMRTVLQMKTWRTLHFISARVYFHSCHYSKLLCEKGEKQKNEGKKSNPPLTNYSRKAFLCWNSDSVRIFHINERSHKVVVGNKRAATTALKLAVAIKLNKIRAVKSVAEVIFCFASKTLLAVW